MIISNSHKYIFVHIHKAAGTSVIFTLDKALGWNDIVIGGSRFGQQLQKPYYDRFNVHKHSSALDVRRLVGEVVWSDYFSFTFVRNPYERAVSLYAYIAGMVKNQRKYRWLRHLPIRRFNNYQKEFWNRPGTVAFLETKTFSDFIRHDLIAKAPGMKPQYQSIVDEDEKIIVDFVGKVERINVDFQKVLRRIGLPETTLLRKNQSNFSIPYANLIKESDYEFLYNLFKKDFHFFGYEPKAGAGSMGSAFAETSLS